jgi:Tol biopolymer transport system component
MALVPGSHVGPYEILAPIGAGGMGEVYRARDTQLKRDVALKVLPADLALDADRLARFDREAQALAALNHPHIAQVHGVAQDGGVRAIVMELVEGEDLAARIARGAIPLDEAHPIARQLAEALEYAHERGIVHRDLKPANIKITPDGDVKVLDFGLAKALELPGAGGPGARANAGLTHSPTMTSPARLRQGFGAAGTEAGIILGTAAYMAPEQARGTVVDKRADIWAFGVVLFEMLTGRPCFGGETVTDVLAAVMRADPDWATLPAATPPRLRELLERCLAKDRKQRLHDMGDARLELERLLAAEQPGMEAAAGDAAAAHAPGRARRSWTKRALGFVALAVLAFVAGGASVLSVIDDGGPNLDDYRLTPFATDAEPESSPAWSPDGKSIAYLKTVDGWSQVFVRTLGIDSPTQVTSLSVDALAPMWTPDGARLMFLSGGSLWSISRAGGEAELVQKEARAATLSPDGKTLALWRTTTEGGKTVSTVWIASPPTTAPRQYVPAPFAVTASLTPNYVRFSPDGRQIAAAFYGSGRLPEIWVLPFPDGPNASPRRHFFEQTKSWPVVARFAWMPDSQRLVLTHRGGLVMGDSRHESLRSILPGPAASSWPAVSPDGRRLAFVSGTTNYDVVGIPLDGAAMKDVLATSQDEHAPAWIPGSPAFVYVADRDGQQQIRIHNQADGSDRAIVTPADFGGALSARLLGLAPSPDGTRIAYRGPDAAVWISPLAGGAPVKALEPGSMSFMWSPDGKWLAYQMNGRLVKSRVGSRDAPQSLTGPRTFRTAPAGLGGSAVRSAWSPTGESIVFQDPDGVMVVDADGRHERVLAPLHARALGWSMDGRTVYAVPADESRNRLVSIDARSGVVRTVSTLDPGVTVDADSTMSVTLSPARDGKSLLTSVRRDKTDLWILEGFDTQRGWFDWWKRRN